MNIEQDQLARAFKDTFNSKSGKTVMENLMLFCRGKSNMSCFDPCNARQTDYNLGANSVLRYIQSMIEMDLKQQANDCITEEKTDG